jgi:hypothetical protein
MDTVVSDITVENGKITFEIDKKNMTSQFITICEQLYFSSGSDAYRKALQTFRKDEIQKWVDENSPGFSEDHRRAVGKFLYHISTYTPVAVEELDDLLKDLFLNEEEMINGSRTT